MSDGADKKIKLPKNLDRFRNLDRIDNWDQINTNTTQWDHTITIWSEKWVSEGSLALFYFYFSYHKNWRKKIKCRRKRNNKM